MSELNELVGKVIISIEGIKCESEKVTIKTNEGVYSFLHYQDCFESVFLNDFELGSDSFEGAIIISAEESTNSEDSSEVKYADSFTWTFYKIETTKGEIWMRWLGESNGYYSESIDFIAEAESK